MMSGHIVAGGYLDPSGLPVRATQAPIPDAPNVVGGYATAKGWVRRWIVAACPDVTVLAGENGTLMWDHERTRFVLAPGEWVVWTGHHFRVVPPERFAVEYADMSYEASPDGA